MAPQPADGKSSGRGPAGLDVLLTRREIDLFRDFGGLPRFIKRPPCRAAVLDWLEGAQARCEQDIAAGTKDEATPDEIANFEAWAKERREMLAVSYRIAAQLRGEGGTEEARAPVPAAAPPLRSTHPPRRARTRSTQEDLMTKKTTTSDPEPQPPPVIEDLSGDPESKPNGPVPSSEPGDLVDLTRFADDDDDPVRSDIRRVRCSLHRPDNFTRFRTWPDRDWWRIYHFLIRERAGQNAAHFLVDKSLLELDELEGRTKRKRLVPYVTKAGALGLWPMGLDESNAYVETALYVCERARTEWVCAVSKGREDGEYHCKDPNPDKVYGEPRWPPHLRLNALISLAFPRDRQILTRNHPELVKLRDED